MLLRVRGGARDDVTIVRSDGVANRPGQIEKAFRVRSQDE
jgi:hypothetical protein